MLTSRDLLTIRAALLYWQEECAGNDWSVMRPYLEAADGPPSEGTPLTTDEITDLRSALRTCRPIHVRPAVVEGWLRNLRLSDVLLEPESLVDTSPAVILLPARDDRSTR